MARRIRLRSNGWDGVVAMWGGCNGVDSVCECRLRTVGGGRVLETVR